MKKISHVVTLIVSLLSAESKGTKKKNKQIEKKFCSSTIKPDIFIEFKKKLPCVSQDNTNKKINQVNGKDSNNNTNKKHSSKKNTKSHSINRTFQSFKFYYIDMITVNNHIKDGDSYSNDTDLVIILKFLVPWTG